MHLYVWKREENTNICIHMYEEVDFYKQNQLSGNNMQWPDIISLRVPGLPVMPDSAEQQSSHQQLANQYRLNCMMLPYTSKLNQ